MSKARGLADLGNVYNDGALSNRNLIINGAMDVAQRGTSSSPAPNGYLIDRFATYKGGGGVYNVEQSPDAPVGFQNSALLTVTTTSTPSGTDFILFQTKIEGHDASYLSQGTASAKTFTLSFWVKSSLAATFSGSVRDGTSTVSYVFEYTINSASTWEYKTVTIAGSTSGTFSLDNTAGLVLAFSQGQGTTYATATVGSWVAGNFHGSTTETDLISNAGATWQITGVQLEIGDTATPFEHRSYGQELALCHRYYERMSHEANYSFIGMGLGASTTVASTHIAYQKKRAIPSLSGVGDFVLYSGSDNTVSSLTFVHITSTRCTGQFVSTGLTQGQAYKAQFHAAGDRYIAIDAEL